MQFFIFIYLFLFAGLIINHYYIEAVISVFLLPAAFFIKKILQKSRVKQFSQKITKAQELFLKNKEFKPFINVNNEHWSVIELIPGINSVQAKTVYNRVKEKRIADFNEFADLTNLEPNLYPFVGSIINF